MTKFDDDVPLWERPDICIWVSLIEWWRIRHHVSGRDMAQAYSEADRRDYELMRHAQHSPGMYKSISVLNNGIDVRGAPQFA